MAGPGPAAHASQTMTDRAFGLPAHPWASLARHGWTQSLLLSRSVPFVGTTVLAANGLALYPGQVPASAFAGVDPYNKYIDRNSDDNVVAVTG